MKTSNVLRRVYGMTAAIIGVLFFFFFIIVGVFGLPLAIAGPAVFVLGTVVVCAYSQPRVRDYETRSFHSRQDSICLYGELSHYFPDNVNRASFLADLFENYLENHARHHKRTWRADVAVQPSPRRPPPAQDFIHYQV